MTVKKGLSDLILAYPSFWDKFVALGLNIEGDIDSEKRMYLRDRYKVLVLESRFPLARIKFEIWQEILRFNGHQLVFAITWVAQMIREMNGVDEFNRLMEPMFATKTKYHNKAG